MVKVESALGTLVMYWDEQHQKYLCFWDGKPQVLHLEDDRKLRLAPFLVAVEAAVETYFPPEEEE